MKSSDCHPIYPIHSAFGVCYAARMFKAFHILISLVFISACTPAIQKAEPSDEYKKTLSAAEVAVKKAHTHAEACHVERLRAEEALAEAKRILAEAQMAPKECRKLVKKVRPCKKCPKPKPLYVPEESAPATNSQPSPSGTVFKNPLSRYLADPPYSPSDAPLPKKKGPGAPPAKQ